MQGSGKDFVASAMNTYTVIPIIVAVAGNLSLAWLFLSALMQPSLHQEFVQNTGALIFLIEFLSIHSNAFAMGLANQEKKPEDRDSRIQMRFYGSFKGGKELTPGQTKWLLIAVYTVAVGGVGLATKNWVLPLIFFVGMISKFFASRATGNPARFALSIMALIVLAFVATVVAFPLGFFIALPNDGAILVWGVLYYFALAFIDSAFFFHKEVSLVWKPFYYSIIELLKVFMMLIRRHPQAARFSGIMQRVRQSAESGGFEAFLRSVSSPTSSADKP